MDTDEARRRLASSSVARLATVRPDGSPHVVPVTFAVAGDTVYTAVDRKPKRHRRLQRLVNLRHEPRCALLADHYEADWGALWWVRADGEAEVVGEPGPEHPALELLASRYPAYRDTPLAGPLIAVTVHRWSGWSAQAAPRGGGDG